MKISSPHRVTIVIMACPGHALFFGHATQGTILDLGDCSFAPVKPWIYPWWGLPLWKHILYVNKSSSTSSFSGFPDPKAQVV